MGQFHCKRKKGGPTKITKYKQVEKKNEKIERELGHVRPKLSLHGVASSLSTPIRVIRREKSVWIITTINVCFMKEGIILIGIMARSFLDIPSNTIIHHFILRNSIVFSFLQSSSQVVSIADEDRGLGWLITPTSI